MRRVDTLLEQAEVLRALAGSFEEPDIRNQLLQLAVRCDEMAAVVRRKITERLAAPVDPSASTETVPGAGSEPAPAPTRRQAQ